MPKFTFNCTAWNTFLPTVEKVGVGTKLLLNGHEYVIVCTNVESINECTIRLLTTDTFMPVGHETIVADLNNIDVSDISSMLYEFPNLVVELA